LRFSPPSEFVFFFYAFSIIAAAVDFSPSLNVLPALLEVTISAFLFLTPFWLGGVTDRKFFSHELEEG